MDSNSGTNKRYVIAGVDKLKDLFPGYQGNDVRTSLDGKQAIYEVNLSEEDLAELKAKQKSVKTYTLAEVQTVINAPAASGVWYQPDTEAPVAVEGTPADAP